MTDEEIMIRAREAAIASMEFGSAANDCIRRGEWDDTRFVKAAAQALRDLDKPLPAIAPDATAEAGPVEHYRLEQDAEGDWGIRALTSEMRMAAAKHLFQCPRDHAFFPLYFVEGQEDAAARIAKEIAATIEPTKAGGA